MGSPLRAASSVRRALLATAGDAQGRPPSPAAPAAWWCSCRGGTWTWSRRIGRLTLELAADKPDHDVWTLIETEPGEKTISEHLLKKRRRVG